MTGRSTQVAAKSVAPAVVQRACACQTGAGDKAEDVQTKLQLGAVGDRYEREADQIADQVVADRTGKGQVTPVTASPLVQRRRDRSEDTETQEDATIAAARAVRSGGRPLALPERQFFETRFGRDLGTVRLHDDEQAERAALGIGARAYALRNHIAFAPGQYDPASPVGKRLLAHELVHTIQQAPSQLAWPVRIGAIPVARSTSHIARDNGKPGGAGKRKAGFRTNKGDLSHLADTLKQLYSGLDAKTYRTLVDNKTLSIGLVLDDENKPRTVYTVSNNWTNKQLAAAADDAGLTRWDPAPRTVGRGKVGAPADAEQLMIGAAEDHGFKVRAMAVSRPVCKDCKVAIKHHETGKIKVVEVSIPKSQASLRSGLAAENKARAKKVVAADKSPVEKKSTTKKPEKTQGKTTKGNAASKPTGGGGTKRASKALTLNPRQSKAGAPKGAGARTGRGGGGAGVGAAVGAAIVALVLDTVLRGYLQNIMDEKNAEAFTKALEGEQGKIERLVDGQADAIKALQDAKSEVFFNVRVRIRYVTDMTGDMGGVTAFLGLNVESVDLVPVPLKKMARKITHSDTMAKEMLMMHVGRSDETLTFSVSYPALDVVSEGEEPVQDAGYPSAVCFIATACYGSQDAPEVVLLRVWRDVVLRRHGLGRAFIWSYYKVSPPIAGWLSVRPRSRRLVRRRFLGPLVGHLWRRVERERREEEAATGLALKMGERG